MRRVAAVLGVAVVALLVGGCGAIGIEQGLTVHPDGSAELSTTLLMPEALVELAHSEGFHLLELEDIEQSVSRQFPGREVRVERIEEGDKVGARVTVHFDRTEEVSEFLTSPQQPEVAPGETITVSPLFSDLTVRRQRGLLGARYTFDATMDTSIVEAAIQDAYRAGAYDSTLADLGLDMEETMRMAMSLFDLRFSVTLPGRIDPTSVIGPGEPEISPDGRTVTWKLPTTEPVTMTAVSKAGLLSGLPLRDWGQRILAAWKPEVLMQLMHSEWAVPALVGVASGTAVGVVGWRMGWWHDGTANRTRAAGRKR